MLKQDAGTRIIFPGNGRVVHPQALAKAKTVLIVPFSPGVNAAASDELNRSALIIIRGIVDGLKSGGRDYNILQDANTARQPDIIIKGRIERLETRGGWKRYFGGRRKRFIRLSGKVIDHEGNLAATFDHELEKAYVDMDEIEFLIAAGRDIGEFLSQ